MRSGILALLWVSAFFLLILTITLVAIEDYVDLPTPYTTGSSPINPGAFGISEFVELLKDYGIRVVYVSNWTYLKTKSDARLCVLVVSPELPYTDEEAEAIVMLLSNSGGILVIADESPVSNTILKHLGSKMRIIGVLLLDEFRDPYPRATFSTDSYRISLRLDKASGIYGCGYVLGFAESYPLLGGPAKQEPVGCVEYVDRVTVLLLGDGSVLANQALRLGGSYRELAKLIATTISKSCGRNCVVYVEAGKYASNEKLFKSLTGDDKDSYYVFLNRIVSYVRKAIETLPRDPIAGLGEELSTVMLLLSLLTVLAKLGRRQSGTIVSVVRITWRGREDFSRVYMSLTKLLTILNCDSANLNTLLLCLDNLGYQRSWSLKFVRFMKLSRHILYRRIFSYIPIWGLLTSRALSYAEDLLGLLEERELRGYHHV